MYIIFQFDNNYSIRNIYSPKQYIPYSPKALAKNLVSAFYFKQTYNYIKSMLRGI